MVSLLIIRASRDFSALYCDNNLISGHGLLALLVNTAIIVCAY